MQRTERLPLLFPRAFVGIAAGKERGISLCFLIFLRLRIPKCGNVLAPVMFEFGLGPKTSDQGGVT